MRLKSVYGLGLYSCGVVLLWLAGGTTKAEPPGAADPKVDPDTVLFVYREPFANSGTIGVFLGTGGKYVRTTPFRLERYDLREGGKLVTVYLNVKMADEDKLKIESQLEQTVLKTPNAPPAVKAENLIWMMPFSVSVELRDPSGAPVGEYTQQIGSTPEKLLRPLSIDPTESMSFPITLKTAAKPTDIGQYRVVVKSNYVVKTAQAQTAVFQAATGAGMVALENVVGAKKGQNLKAGDLIHRNATQLVTRSQFVQRNVKLIDANTGDEKLVLELLQKSLAKDVQYKDADWITLGMNYTIWTPALGQLEITPTSTNFEENEKSLKKSSKEGYKEKLKLLKQDAKNATSFKDWFNQQKRKRSGEGSGAANFEFEADLMDMLSNNTSGGASYSFRNAVDNEDTDKGSTKQTEDIFKLLVDDKDVEKLFESSFESYWKGSNKIVDFGAKAFNLAVVRDAADASRELTEITRLRTYGTTSLPFQTAEIELKSAAAVVREVAELRRQVAELSDKLTAPFGGPYWLVNGTKLDGGPRWNISHNGGSAYTVYFNYGVAGKLYGSKATLDKDGSLRVDEFLRAGMEKTAEGAIIKNCVGIRLGKHIFWSNGEHWLRD